MPKVLFICSQAKLRSPTAEAVFAEYPGVETMSAGLDKGAASPLSSDMIEWADQILVMEKRHKSKLSERYRAFLKEKRVGVLGIPDDYDYMDEALVKRLQTVVPRYPKL